MSILRKSERENASWPKATPLYAAGLIILTYCLVAFTGLKRTIPGYPSAKSRQEAVDNMAKVDSLERVIAMWSEQISAIQHIAGGRNPSETFSPAQEGDTDTTISRSLARKDTLLRETVRNLDKPVKTKN